MRILKFAKIDLIKTKSVPFFLFFPILSIVLLVRESDTPTFFSCLYCLFGGIILSSMPFTMECKANSGFLKMLPSKNGEEIRGHFLYSFIALLLSMTLSLAAIAIAQLIRPQVSFGMLWIYPLLFGIALLFTALENTVFCLFHYDSTTATQLLRIAPGFLFFFGPMLIYENVPQILEWFAAQMNVTIGWIILLICFMVFLSISQICVTIDTHRDH